MTQAGAEIDQRVVFGERGSLEEIEDMASRSGLIRNHFGIQVDELGRWLLKLKDAAEQFVEIVIAGVICGIGCGVGIGIHSSSAAAPLPR